MRAPWVVLPLLVVGCAANAEPPLTAAEKERLIHEYADAATLRKENDPQLPVACKTSTGAVRVQGGRVRGWRDDAHAVVCGVIC